MTLIRRGLLFLLIFTALQLGWQAARGTWLEQVVIHDVTVSPAAAAVNFLTPDAHALAIKFSINAPGGGLNVLNGCEGTEALFLLLAAFLVAPLPWRSRFGGFLLGVGMVFVVNQLRILALFYAYRADHALFDPLHGTVAPILVILLVAGYFYGWLLYSRPRSTVPI
ncbi:MAG TPA: exosortase/archaeosortase family protein [Steroidobacteraceae bacterium]|nr:exosortase/archaeosortase family protein [Steroidobacteraceae bacterium]